MSVGLSAHRAELYLRHTQNSFKDLVVACVNSPENVTISGSDASIDRLKATLDSDNIFSRKLAVNIAYHSPQMLEVAQQYTDALANVDFGSTNLNGCVMMSSLLGRKVAVEDLRKPSYWVDNLVSPVLFTTAFQHIICKNVAKKLDKSHLKSLRVDICIEIGPHAALRGPIRDILIESGQDRSIQYLAVLERHCDASITFLKALGYLSCNRYQVDWMQANHEGVTKTDLVSLCDLPEYSFDHSKTYWHESRRAKAVRFQHEPKHDLLGKRVLDWNKYEARWQHFIRLTELPWLEDHKVRLTSDSKVGC